MRQHVNPLSINFKKIIPVPPLNEIFEEPLKPLHLDIGCGQGSFLIELALKNKDWNYIGLEIREKLVLNAKLKQKKESIDNLFFAFGNADNLIQDFVGKFQKKIFYSVSFNFPDPWFKKRHHKRRVIQPELIYNLSKIMISGGFISIKSDVAELYKYMDSTITESSSFIKYEYKHDELNYSFNPINLKTNRENYVISKRLNIYEGTYKKI